jgi:hypothetical protein
MTESQKTSDDGGKVVKIGLRLSAPKQEQPGQPEELNQSISPIIKPGDVPLESIGSKFTTRLQLLWTFVGEIGPVAASTSFTNMASVLALFADINESSKGRKPTDALADCEFTVAFQRADGTTDEIAIPFTVFERRHLKSLSDRVKYHDAALRLLHETAVQQLVNAYEQLMGDMVRRYIFRNHSSAAADERISYRELLAFSSLEEAQRRVVEKQVVDFVRDNDTAQHLKY